MPVNLDLNVTFFNRFSYRARVAYHGINERVIASILLVFQVAKFYLELASTNWDEKLPYKLYWSSNNMSSGDNINEPVLK